MRERLRILGYFAIFWITLQIIIRAIFIIYNHELAAQLSLGEIFQVFFHGFKMDLSISGYFLMATGLILSISVFTAGSWLRISLNTLTVLLLLLISIIVIVDAELYRHWGFRLNTTPFLYLGSEAMGSISLRVIFNLTAIFVLLLSGTLFLYRKVLEPKIRRFGHPASKTSFSVLLIISGLMFIPIRGSFTVAPMNTGFVYFHKNSAFANHAAINVVWNFLYSLRKGSNIQYPENFYDPVQAEIQFEKLHEPETSDAQILLFSGSSKPNIILIILESFTADVIEPLGGLKDITPNINRFCKEGVLFQNMYASGDRTDKGIISILSGYPAQPATSIIKYPAKSQSLPSLNHYMKKIGYRTSFTYGGDIDFANFRSYLTNAQFDHITTEDDFDDDLNYSKWGVHDHIVLDKAFQECDTASNPFFKVILTSSSHEPFDVPLHSKHLTGNDEESLFLNSVFYADSAVGTFISKAKASSWWSNTVVIMVADHGHRNPGNKPAHSKERFRIPFLVLGGLIKKDTVIDTYCNQTDIPNTLLGQFHAPSSDFKFSRNILVPGSKSFSFYFFNDGYGYVAPGQYVVYDNAGKQFIEISGVSPQQADSTKAYQQILYRDYNRR